MTVRPLSATLMARDERYRAPRIVTAAA